MSLEQQWDSFCNETYLQPDSQLYPQLYFSILRISVKLKSRIPHHNFNLQIWNLKV